MRKEFILKNFKDLQRAISLLDGSVKKYKPYNPRIAYTAKQMEYYDALSFRFEKTVEVSLYFFRTMESYLYSKDFGNVYTAVVHYPYRVNDFFPEMFF